ncbi:hypothetical protein CHKEEEPN_3365 [Methylorubrum podarium]|nr:hypothetical protein CHKEEEPN_3365 [Methylorubrum podarium]
MATTQPASPQKVAEPVSPPPASMARAEEDGDRFLPTGALPFAAVDAVWDAARSAGTGAVTGAVSGAATGVATLGSSVVTFVSDLR